MRRYSLINDGSAPEVYKIAVKREPESRGGSASMHDEATVGTELRVEPPENDFPMGEANEYLLIAGGIGVTPIYSMAQQLDREGKPFNIIYCTRSPEDTAYLDEMRAAFGDRLLVHHDEGDPEKVYDFWDHFEEPKKMHVYCCGPAPLMEEIEAISGHWPEGRVNFEDFKPVDVVREDDKAFDVVLEKSGKRVTVPEDRSILEALRDAGVATVSSCESGTCGTCKTRLLSGEVDHRDMVLMDEEKSENIMICVSRAKEGELVLDL
jgi:phthalate 4,5-dioxygenase reductase subunit